MFLWKREAFTEFFNDKWSSYALSVNVRKHRPSPLRLIPIVWIRIWLLYFQDKTNSTGLLPIWIKSRVQSTEEYIKAMNFKFHIRRLVQKLPIPEPLATYLRLHCKRSKWNRPDISSVLAIRKRGDRARYDWHICKVVRVKNRAEMRVSVEYYDSELREAL